MPMELVIEYPAAGKTYSHDEYGVYEYSTYPRGSVLEGQTKRSFIDRFATLEEAKAAYPSASWSGEGSGFVDMPVPATPPAWFDPDAIGESWDE